MEGVGGYFRELLITIKFYRYIRSGGPYVLNFYAVLQLYFFIFPFGLLASGPKECNLCLENNATSCSKNQETHTCATDPTTLGTTHCGSAVGRYRDSKGNVVDGFIRGCINCEGKQT